MVRRKAFILGVLFLATATARAGTKLVLSSNAKSTVPEKEFACGGAIYGQVIFDDSKKGPHRIEGVWTGPQGEVIERSDSPIDCGKGRRTAMVWMTLKPKGKTIFDPTSDGGEAAYNGSWHVDVLWDGQKVARGQFNMACP